MRTIYPILLLVFISSYLNAQEKYTNKTFGFSMELPVDWSESSHPDTTKNLILTDKERTTLLIKEKSVFLTEYYYVPASYKDILIPKIQINAVMKPENDFSSFKKEAIRSAELLKNQLEDFEFISKPAETTISGIKSIHFSIKYTMVLRGQRLAIRNHIYAIPYKNYLFHISLVDGPANDQSKNFDSLISTIKI